MLADHPNVFARLRNEVLETLGSTGKVNPENLKEMKYLRAVLNGKLPPSLGYFSSVDGDFRDTAAVPKRVSFWYRADQGQGGEQ